MRKHMHIISISTEKKLNTYLFSTGEEKGYIIPQRLAQADSIEKEIRKVLRKLENPNALVYTRLNISSSYETGIDGAGPIQAYTPVINGKKYQPHSIWACRNHIDSSVEYRTSGVANGSILISRKQFLEELKTLILECIELEFYEQSIQER